MPNISPILLRDEIARRLRAARQAAEISSADAAQRLDMSRPNLSRIETGQQSVNVHLVRTMMDVYDFRDDDLLEKVRASRKPGWWKAYGVSDQDFVALETGAHRMFDFAAQVVPGLLQTADYARAVIEASRERRTDEWIANALNVRLIRQDRLSDEDHPLNLVAVIDELALYRPVGGSRVMHAQLRHLALVSELPTVTVLVLPMSTFTNVSAYGSFAVLDFPSGQPSIAYTKHVFGQQRSSDPESLRAARLDFDHLRSLALNPARSAARIEQLADALCAD